jgi:hypothetical protein
MEFLLPSNFLTYSLIAHVVLLFIAIILITRSRISNFNKIAFVLFAIFIPLLASMIGIIVSIINRRSLA